MIWNVVLGMSNNKKSSFNRNTHCQPTAGWQRKRVELDQVQHWEIEPTRKQRLSAEWPTTGQLRHGSSPLVWRSEQRAFNRHLGFP